MLREAASASSLICNGQVAEDADMVTMTSTVELIERQKFRTGQAPEYPKRSFARERKRLPDRRPLVL